MAHSLQLSSTVKKDTAGWFHMVSKRMHAQPKDMARKKPCFVQNFEQRLQDLLVLWLWQIEFTGGEQEGCHHGRSCPAFHLIHTLHSTFPGSCKDLETGFWQIVFFVDYKRYKRYLLKIGLVTFCVKRFFKNPDLSLAALIHPEAHVASQHLQITWIRNIPPSRLCTAGRHPAQ